MMPKFKADDKVVFSSDKLFYGRITKDSVLNVLEVVKDTETNIWMVSLKEEGQHIFFYEDDLDLFDENSIPHDPDHQDIHQQLSEAKRLLNKAAEYLEDCHNYDLAEEINNFLGEN